MPGPRSTCRAPAGSASTRPRACSPARATSRSPRRRTTAPPRRSRARVEPGRDRLRLRDDGHPRRRGAADHHALLRRRLGALDALGERVDADLAAQDVRLTMGGEPTFVSVDDFEAPEWNVAAVGPTKRGLADQLIRRLRDRFAPGRPAPLRPGQVVSRREPAALGLRALLAQGRRADLARPGPDRPRGRPAGEAGTADDRAGQGRSPTPWPAASASPTTSSRPSRTALWVKKAATCRSTSRPTRPGPAPWSSRPDQRVFERGPRGARRLRPAARSLPTGTDGDADRVWIRRPWAVPPRRRLPGAGRLAALGFRLPLSSLPYVPPEHYPYYQPQDPLEPRGRRLPDGPIGSGGKAAVNGVRHHRRARCAPRWRSSRGRRPAGVHAAGRARSKTISSSPPLEAAAEAPERCRSTSRATRRRPTRASA